ncbi:hypothetical protein KOR34_17610 [Posidoniimonas corsicana]|uniref:Uncharacterized protein n=1 Tax=Posidoniimonas corsicana TaxID=1938618 RepID=A0A5C5VDX9_9BACT|nr:hypothetical protein [Posidoniimonas corsicana]TWT36816.1 hypothetical protein KOR34_17610 [Posidoniimonas corsicana]
MHSTLNALAAGEEVTREQLEELAGQLIEALKRAIRVDEVEVIKSRIDVSGAFPGWFCKLACQSPMPPFQYQWQALLSLDGYDQDDGARGINCCAHVLVFVSGKRVASDSGSVIRLDLRESDGVWKWVESGWEVDEYQEFEDIVAFLWR